MFSLKKNLLRFHLHENTGRLLSDVGGNLRSQPFEYVINRNKNALRRLIWN